MSEKPPFSTPSESDPERPQERRHAKTRAPLSEADARGLLHELEVHQLELEQQNEELRAARSASERALASYTQLFDHAPIGYATLSREETILEINYVGAELLGRPRAQCAGLRFSDLVAVEHRAAFSQLIARAQQSGERETCDLTLKKTGQPPLHLRVTAAALARERQWLLLAFEDISEQKQHQQKLARTEQALRETDRRKEEFLAMLSHELRNPLTPIKNSVFVLSRAEPESEQAHKARAIIDRQVTHLTRLIDDLLDVSRVARGQIELERRRVELRTLVKRTLDDHRMSFEAMGVELREDLEVESSWVDADPARLVQVVNNLLGNSLKFTLRGGRVLVTLKAEGSTLCLRVSDSGIGIAPGHIDQLFAPFVQAPQSIDRASGGLGLGLAMVKGLVELHGGRVELQSPGLGMGTEVTVTLPRQSPPEQVSQVALPPSVRSRRVLVIEDNLDASETLQDALKLSGHQVQTAYDGPHGLALSREFEPDVVICDIGLPGMDGFAVARAFRADPELRRVALVALSGYAQPEDLKRATAAGFDCHLAKPTSLERIQSVLAALPLSRRAGATNK